jgi:5-formyltetrahydrofolate cyclo-ligase
MKNKIRKDLLKQRDAITPEQKILKESAIEERLFCLDAFKQATSILLYVSFRSEVDTRRYLDDVIKLNKKLVLPAVDSKHRKLNLYEVRDISELEPGYMGILEPRAIDGMSVTLKDIDLVIIPGTGFDRNGNRLGYGGGYYDKLLSYESKQLSGVDKHITTIALAFEEQVGDDIPAEPHDINVDMIVTDKRLIKCLSK